MDSRFGEQNAAHVELTSQRIAQKPLPRIFEATLEHERVLIRADVMEPGPDGYRMIEVKSSTRFKAPNAEDLAVQVWVARSAGVPLADYRLAHIDTGFVYPSGGNYRCLLVEG